MEYRHVFERAVRVYDAATALRTDDGQSLTYGDFGRRSGQLAAALEARIGDAPVAVLANNGIPAAAALVAGHRRGAPTVQLPFRGAVGELREMIAVSGAQALVFDDANAATAGELLGASDLATGIHAGDETIDADGLGAGTDIVACETVLADAPAALPAELPREGDTNVFFTSGTTSVPKAVPFGGEAMWLGAAQTVMEHGIDQTDVAIVTTPWYHMVTAGAWLYPHWLAGATTVMHSAFDAEEVLDLIETHEATGLLAVPTQLDALASATRESDADLGTLSYVRTGGAVLSPDLVERTTARLGAPVTNIYGLTEAGPNLTYARPEAQRDHPGTVGTESFGWEVRVVEPVGLDEQPDPEATVDAGERGEVLARGPAVPDGYLDNPEAEARTFFGEWLRTRDVAEIDGDGYLYVVDRIDNMFTSGGENIYPAEVQRAVADHEAVAECCVAGLPDDHWGYRVAAVVVRSGEVDGEELDAFLRETDRLADYKRPREWAFRSDPLPRTDTGTIEREHVRQEEFQ